MNRKLFIALLSVIALVAFASTGFALHASKEMFEYTPQIVKSKKAMINISGQIRVRGEIRENADFQDTVDSTGANDDQQAYYDERVRLRIDATVSPNTMGTLEIESGSSNGTEGAANADTWKWGTCTSSATGTYKNGSCKPTELFVRQAYISHQGSGLLGVKAGFKAGHQLISLGNGLFLNHSDRGDDALIFWVAPVDGMEASLSTVKFTEVTTPLEADANLYVFALTHSMDNINFGVDVSYLDERTRAGLTPTATTFDLWNIGIRGDTAVSGINLKADVEFQTGNIDNSRVTSGATADMDIGGFAILAGADTNLGDINVNVEFAYGSGNDISDTTEDEGFVTSLASGQRSTFIADYRVAGAGTGLGVGSANYLGTANNGLNNMWYVNVGGATNINPDIKVAADVFYLQASEEVSATPGLDEKDMGVEVDGKITYQIDNNLVYYVEGGYLFAGDFYKNKIGSATTDPDDAYAVRHGLLLTF